ncbi:hypothetical protein INT47_010958 [Mucor saturninus]|uniref:Uncharacterized protein n=1 Tax=Mucor saturninus TaxID=64648 RepID=A0A8H7RAZ6_9FUNG|nr:hypothetical protein INT47_010958 [Mucor saturninus]
MDLLTSQEDLQTTFQPIIPIRGCMTPYRHWEEEEEEEDGYFYHGCYADIQVPSVKQRMYFPRTIADRKIPQNEVLLNDNKTLFLTLLKTPRSLDGIDIPQSDFYVTICYHGIERSSGLVLKCIQIYIHPTGQSYTVMIDHTCLLKNLKTLQFTQFGRLLKDPDIKRICWNPRYIQSAVEHQLGFSLGKCIDLSVMFPTFTLSQSIHLYLSQWQDKNQFDYLETLMHQKDVLCSCWSCPFLPLDVQRYCAVEAWAAYSLYRICFVALQ